MEGLCQWAERGWLRHPEQGGDGGEGGADDGVDGDVGELAEGALFFIAWAEDDENEEGAVLQGNGKE